MVELTLKDGDYVPDGRGGFRRSEGDEALLQRVLWKLGVRRGSFPFLPELGSRLYLLPRAREGERLSLAKEYVAEALKDERGLVVETVELRETGQGSAALQVGLRQGARSVTAEIEV